MKLKVVRMIQQWFIFSFFTLRAAEYCLSISWILKEKIVVIFYKMWGIYFIFCWRQKRMRRPASILHYGSMNIIEKLHLVAMVYFSYLIWKKKLRNLKAAEYCLNIWILKEKCIVIFIRGLFLLVSETPNDLFQYFITQC